MTLAHIIGIVLAVTVGLVMLRLGMEFSDAMHTVFSQYDPTK